MHMSIRVVGEWGIGERQQRRNRKTTEKKQKTRGA
jgi:hypothetical protein